jgi:DNA-binding MarR family transcriptional regulator
MTPEEPQWKLFALMSGIYLKSRRLAEETLKPLNMTWPQFGGLFHLIRQDNITQRELAQQLETDTTTVMVICDSLEKRGWLTRAKDPTDRRVNRLLLTDAGRTVFTQAYPLMMTKYTIYANAISPHQIDAVLPILETLYQVVNTHYHQELGT